MSHVHVAYHTHRSGPHKHAVRLLCVPLMYVHDAHTTHTRIYHDQTCVPVVHTRIVNSVVAVPSSSSKRSKKLKCEVPAHTRKHLRTRTRIIAYTKQTRIQQSRLILGETWSVGSCTRHILDVGTAAADSHSCWWRRRRWCCSC